ncbi:MAG: ATP-binding protein [Flavobacterium sp.]|nr:ATP-binding protein [Flavobacterium sp.]
MIKRTSYLTQLQQWIDKPLVKILTGIRRSGKSTVLLLLKEELVRKGIPVNTIHTLNFESFTTEHLKNATSLYAHLAAIMTKGQKFYLLLDEIQEVQEWEKVINSLLVDYSVDIYLTGSNSHLLSSELATYLAGRYIEIPVYTLSFSEYLAFNAVYQTPVLGTKESFATYLRKGGFPLVHTANYDEHATYKVIRDIYASVLLRDTIQRYKIRDIELLERVIRYVFDNVGNTFSGKSIADYFKSQYRKTDVNTIYNYLTALEGAFILYRVSRFDIKGKEILKTQEKFFVSDLSLIYAMMGYRDQMISGILENIVFLELKRREYQVYIGKLDTREIDFIAEKQGKRIYVQVAYKLESDTTIEREFSPLLALPDQFPKYVVTMDEFWKEDVQGVKHFQIHDFLLDNRY